MKKLGVLCLVVVTVLITGCGKEKDQTKEPEVIISTEENVIKNQNFDGLTMTNTSLITENGSSTLVTQVTNNTGADYYLNEFVITVKDVEGNVLATLPGYVGDVIPNGETRVIDSNIDIDLSKATSIEYNVTK